jgi:hypothetical protein
MGLTRGERVGFYMLMTGLALVGGCFVVLVLPPLWAFILWLGNWPFMGIVIGLSLVTLGVILLGD